MHWILIIWLFGASYSGDTGTAVDHIQFDSEQQCKAAFAKVKAINDGGHPLYGACVEGN